MDIDKLYKCIVKIEAEYRLNPLKGISSLSGVSSSNLIFARIKNNLAKLKLTLNEDDGHLNQENTAIKKDVEADIALLATIGLISISESDKLVDFINE